MSVSRENHLGDNSGGATLSSLVITLVAGASIDSHVLVGVCWGAADRTTAVTDSKGNTYQQDSTCVASSNFGRIFSGKVTTELVTNDTITVTWTGGTVNNPGASATAYTGVKLSGWFREENSGTATSNNISSGDLTTVETGDLLYGIAYIQIANAVTPGTNWTELSDFVVATTRRFHSQERVVPSAGTYQSTATTTGAPIWIGLASAYQEEAGGGGEAAGEMIGVVPI